MQNSSKKLVTRRSVIRGTGGMVLASTALSMPFINRSTAQERVIKIGVMAPISGIRANFAEPLNHTLAVAKAAIGAGLDIGGTTYPVEFIVKDNQSTPTRSIQVGNELILQDEPDIILCIDAEGATAIGPVADARGIATLSTIGPWQGWAFSRQYNPEKGFPYTFHFFFGVDELGVIFPRMWNMIDNNRKIGGLFNDDDAGRAMSSPEIGFPPAFAKEGYEFSANTGLFRRETDDFTTQISAFKEAGVDIVAGIAFENQVATFWNQAAQLGFRPKICTIASGLLFPSSVNNLGDRGDGMSTEVWWTPGMPFKSSLNGQTAAQIGEAYTAETGRQWTQPLGYYHAAIELGIHALKTSGNPKDRDAIRDALANTTLDTVAGRVDFAGSPLKSVGVTHTAPGQWQKAKSGPFRYNLEIVDNSTNPDVNVTADFKPLAY